MEANPKQYLYNKEQRRQGPSTTASSTAGYYKVYVRRLDQDLYKDQNSGLYIKTRYCYEYAYGAEALLKDGGAYDSKLIFESGGACDVESIFK
ncbi:MAG: hypothetical protein EHM36_03115 [Deltaproteobacteria bacterium]|nr:MAG: hypothetical protein EHM36_03115 [Deltaproteobacteria bacterium]